MIEPVRFCPRCGGPIKMRRAAVTWTKIQGRRKATQYENRITCEKHPGYYWIEYIEVA